jgi:hypothetical protein
MQQEFLLDQLSPAAFVDDADMIFDNLCEAWISGATTFVHRQLMRFGASHANTEADLDSGMNANRRGISSQNQVESTTRWLMAGTRQIVLSAAVPAGT